MFNEEAGASRCVRSVCAVLDTMPHRCTLVVVDDGSRDGTRAILRALESEHAQLSVVWNEHNRGYGAALQSGVCAAAKLDVEYALFMDSDLTNAPADIPRFAALMETGVDVIKATRYSRGGRVDGVPTHRIFISAVGNRLAKMLMRMPLHDCTNGFRAVRLALLTRMTLREPRFPIIMEELYWCRALGATFAEIPVTLVNRSPDQRPTMFAYKPQMFWRYLKYPLRAFFGQVPDRGSAADAP